MTIDQPTLPGLAEGERLRDEGMQRVTEASDDRVVRQIDLLIKSLNARSEPWSANDLRRLVDLYYPLINEQKPQLLGARVRAAATRRPREMVKVGRAKSTLPSTHAAEVAVWRGVGGAS